MKLPSITVSLPDSRSPTRGRRAARRRRRSVRDVESCASPPPRLGSPHSPHPGRLSLGPALVYAVCRPRSRKNPGRRSTRLEPAGGPSGARAADVALRPNARAAPPRAPIQHRLSEPREEGAREGGAPAGLLVLEVDVDALPGRDLAHACR